MKLANIIYSTTANKCPRCHQGKVFKNRNPYILRDASKMEETCECCGLTYEKEPGFFFGAMYVSYALMSGIFILIFLADLFFINMEALQLMLFFIFTTAAIFPLIFRWSRLLWLNFFFSYDKSYSTKGKILHIKETK